MKRMENDVEPGGQDAGRLAGKRIKSTPWAATEPVIRRV